MSLVNAPRDIILVILNFIGIDGVKSLIFVNKVFYEFFQDPKNYSTVVKHILYHKQKDLGSEHISFSEIHPSQYKVFVDDEMKKQKAEKMVEKGRNIFVTGLGGCGKTYFVNKLCGNLDVLQTATTGTASSDIGGSTIHSALGFGLAKDEFYDKLNCKILSPEQAAIRKMGFMTKRRDSAERINFLNRIKILRIDEISMMGPHYFDYLHYCLKLVRTCEKPFGGIQLILSGDFRQLLPIKDRAGPNLQEIENSEKIVIHSKIWKEASVYIVDLKFSYRQKEDIEYSLILKDLSEGIVSYNSIQLLKERIRNIEDVPDEAVIIYPHNKKVDEVNQAKLEALPGNLKRLPTLVVEHKDVMSTYNVKVDQNETKCLYLKLDCKVMITRNISISEGIVNGAIAYVKAFKTNHLGNISSIVLRIVKTNKTYELDRVTRTFKAFGKVAYTTSQFPLKLGYAFTINGIQGKTVDYLFAYCGSEVFGLHMIYVALSRVKTLKNLYLDQFDPTKIRVEKSVMEFLKKGMLDIKIPSLIKKDDFHEKANSFIQKLNQTTPKINPSRNKRFKPDEFSYKNAVSIWASKVGDAIGMNTDNYSGPVSFSADIYGQIIDLQYGIEKEKLETPVACINGMLNEPFIIEIHKDALNYKHISTEKFHDEDYFSDLSTAKPDSIFENKEGLCIPLEVKSPVKSYQTIPMKHAMQLLFEMICMDRRNSPGKTPYGDYLAIEMDPETREPVHGSNIVALRMYRDESLIKKMRHRLSVLYFHYIFENKTVPLSIYDGWSPMNPVFTNIEDAEPGFKEFIKNQFPDVTLNSNSFD